MKCHWFDSHHCNSCGLMNLSYSESLNKKEQELLNLFYKKPLNLQKTIESKPVFGSRNKAKLAVRGRAQDIEFGFYDSELNFKKLEECPLHLEGINDLLPELTTSFKKYNIVPYDLHLKKGELKYVIISKSPASKELLIRFVVRSKESFDRLKKMAREWEERGQNRHVMSVNIQPDHKAIFEGDEEIVVTESKMLNYQLGDVHLNLGAKSFFQVTPNVAFQLYDRVRSFLNEQKIHSLLDLYCGVGAFSFFAASTCQKVLGVELSSEAIEAANSSKMNNKILGQLDFKSLDVELFLKQVSDNFEAILVNPPRRGLSSTIIENMLRLKPKMIIYSSCNASTLARDVMLLEKDYAIFSSQIFDMFPFTEHYETLMILVRKQEFLCQSLTV